MKVIKILSITKDRYYLNNVKVERNQSNEYFEFKQKQNPTGNEYRLNKNSMSFKIFSDSFIIDYILPMNTQKDELIKVLIPKGTQLDEQYYTRPSKDFKDRITIEEY